MKGILAWLAAALIVYGIGGLWVGTQMRPAVQRYERIITTNVSSVTAVLGR